MPYTSIYEVDLNVPFLLLAAGCNASGHWPSVGRLESGQAGFGVSVLAPQMLRATEPLPTIS